MLSFIVLLPRRFVSFVEKEYYNKKKLFIQRDRKKILNIDHQHQIKS